MAIAQKHKDVDTFFGSEKINEDVSLLGIGVGVAVKKTVSLELNR